MEVGRVMENEGREGRGCEESGSRRMRGREVRENKGRGIMRSGEISG